MPPSLATVPPSPATVPPSPTTVPTSPAMAVISLSLSALKGGTWFFFHQHSHLLGLDVSGGCILAIVDVVAHW